MGLDFSRGNAHWSYSGFHRFRGRLASAALLPVASHPGRLDEFFAGWHREHALSPLLHHSDCDGELSPQECARVAPALKAILEQWPEDDYDRQHGLVLVAAMEECAASNEPLEFC